MNVLSLFNGMSFGKMALESLDIKVNKHHSSEIDKYANQATQAMFPDTVQLGDAIIVEKVIRWKRSTIEKALKSKYLKKGAIKINMALPIKKAVEDGIDLVTGGFPCQAWSMAGKQLGDKDERGMLFWTMLDIMKHVKYHNPKADFLIENVKMKKEFEQYITTHTENALGKVHKILINSALVSAQNRNRYYWTSFPVTQPEDKGILLKDIIEDGFVDRDNAHCIDANYFKGGNLKSYFEKRRRQLVFKCGDMRGRYIVDGKRGDHLVGSQKGITEQRLELRKDDKTNTLTTVQKDNYVVKVGQMQPYPRNYKELGLPRKERYEAFGDGSKSNSCLARSDKNLLSSDGVNYRKLTPRECFRLQTVPEHHIDTLLNAGISNTQLYKMAGNGWTCEVIKHIFKALSIN
tara:strand:+ start:2262 stop:3476 length:1215 start_codon:yes stop_codon:yes gene_type:complete